MSEYDETDYWNEWWPEDGFTVAVESNAEGFVATWLQVGIGTRGKTRVDALRGLADTLTKIDDWASEKFDSERDHSTANESIDRNVIVRLRESTGAPILQCIQVYNETGDYELARRILAVKGD